MTAVIVIAVVFALLLIAFVAFYRYSRTPAWGESETRKAVLRTLVIIGPIFGMHYREPRPEIPTISTPKRDDEPAVPGIVVPNIPGREEADDHG